MDVKTATRLSSLNSENNSEESSGSTTKPNNTLGEVTVASNKRKASVQHKSPRKRQKVASQTTEVVVEAVLLEEINRKARTEERISRKKQKDQSNKAITSENLREKTRKRKANPKTERPAKKHRGENNATDTRGPTKVSVESVRETGSRKTSRAAFEAKYLHLDKLGEGGFGAVHAGYRLPDYLPVAIKHIPKADVEYRTVVLHGRTHMIPKEALLMMRVAGGPRSVGKSAAVTLLDWYDLDEEVLLVMERPVPSVDLLTYINDADGPLEEGEVKNIMKQLVEAALDMHSKRVFHRDLKTENILVETSSDVPRVRVIDFGCGCFVKTTPYHCFCGTSAHAPPEFCKGGTYEAGPTTIWQLGVLLYEMLEEQFTASEFLSKNIKFNRELSQECQDLLNMCLAVNPNKRATLEQIQHHPWLT